MYILEFESSQRHLSIYPRTFPSKETYKYIDTPSFTGPYSLVLRAERLDIARLP